MKIYCAKCRRDTKNIDPKMVRTKNNRLIMQSKCSVCGIKKSRFQKLISKGKKQIKYGLTKVANFAIIPLKIF